MSDLATVKVSDRDVLRADVARARAELAQTFDALEYKLNVPLQIRRAVGRSGVRIRTLARENPAMLGGIVLAAAAVVGGAVWSVVRAASRD